MKFGAHMSTGGGVWTAIQRGHSIGCEIVQIFVKSNLQWFGNPFDETEVGRFTAELRSSGIGCVFGHAGYLINLGAPPSANRSNSIKSLVQEVELATQLSLPFLVLHPGAHLGKGEPEGLRQIISGLDEVISATRNSLVRIALENTAGQGTSLGCRIEHLGILFEGVKNPDRLALCLDTAHLFASGYNIRHPDGWNSVIEEVSRRIGLEQIVAFHLNDSKTGLGSRIDRHAHIGGGEIGKDAFRHIVNDPRFIQTPGCLETPKSKDLHEDIENLQVLCSLVYKTKKAASITGRKANLRRS
jgi:deoxyribonuclease IV